jgi:hypothetical protein
MAKLIERKGSAVAQRGSGHVYEENSQPREITTEGILRGMVGIRPLFSKDYDDLIMNSTLIVRDSDEQVG